MRWLNDYRRRLRVRSIILGSHRRISTNEWGRWIQLEIAKGFVPAILLALLDFTKTYPVSEPVVLALLALAIVWTAFVLTNAWLSIRRVNKKHIAIFEEAGISYNWRDCLLSREAA